MTGIGAAEMKTKAILALSGSIIASGSGLVLGACQRPNSEAASPALKGAAVLRSDDEAITERVKARLAADAELLPLPITVQTRDGVVTLRGVVPSAITARAAQLVERIAGVRTVDNRLEAAAAP